MKQTIKPSYETPVSEEIKIRMTGMIANSPGGGETPVEEPSVDE